MSDHPLKAYRSKKKLTQEALAALADVTQPVISRIEQGLGVGRKSALRVYEAVGKAVPLTVLVGLEEPSSKRPAAASK